MRKCATSSISSTTTSTISTLPPSGWPPRWRFPSASLARSCRASGAAARGAHPAREPGEAILRRYDPATRALFLNPYSPAATRSFQMAFQIAGLEEEAEIGAIVRRAGFRTAEAAEICRIGLMNYFAGALMLPYRPFLTAAKELRHDLELLAARFGASLEQVAHRLSTLQRPGLKGVPVFFARIDRAGNITKRHSAARLQFARYGAACPLWNAHQAFETPGRIIRQLGRDADGVRYLWRGHREIAKGGGGFNAPHRRYAIRAGLRGGACRRLRLWRRAGPHQPGRLDPSASPAASASGVDCCSARCRRHKRRLAVDHDSRAILPYSIFSGIGPKSGGPVFGKIRCSNRENRWPSRPQDARRSELRRPAGCRSPRAPAEDPPACSGPACRKRRPAPPAARRAGGSAA